MNYVGNLLTVKKKVIGFITPLNTTIVNVEVNEGCYLIVDCFIDKKQKVKFLEIIIDKKLVLVRCKNIEEIGFLC